MLLQIQSHTHAARVAHDVGGALRRGLDTMAPRELEVRDQQPVTAPVAKACLECHEHPWRVAVTCNALAQHQLDTSDDPASQAEVFGEGPFRQTRLESQPQRAVVFVPKPCGTMGGLKSDEC